MGMSRLKYFVGLASLLLITAWLILRHHSKPSPQVIQYDTPAAVVKDHGVIKKMSGIPLMTSRRARLSPFEADTAPVDTLLSSEFAPSTVFYVFCQQEHFRYRHYMAIKSVVRNVRPDKIMFYYDKKPINNSPYYETFFQELQDEHPFFHVVPLTDVTNMSTACDGEARPKWEFVLGLLNKTGGMYFHETTLLTSKYTFRMRTYDVINALERTSNQGFALLNRNTYWPSDWNTPHDHLKIKMEHCPGYWLKNMTAMTRKSDIPLCVNLDEDFWPLDIVNLESDFGGIFREVMYGSSEIQAPRQDYNDLIPNIIHMVWLGGGQMDFLFYLSVLSAIFIGEAEMIYIHGDGEPTGSYWDTVKGHPKVKYVWRQRPTLIHGSPIADVKHVTDVWRVDLMIRYGGIYLDTDAIIVRKLDLETRAYDAVASLDWPQWDLPFPEVINFGVTAGKRNAKYWHLFKKTFTWFIDSDWYFNGLKRPYTVWERHPNLLKLDPHLQVICFQDQCHPTWVDDFHNEDVNHKTQNSITNFKTDAFAFHWTFPNPKEFEDEQTLRSMNHTLFGQIGNYVLEKAGLL